MEKVPLLRTQDQTNIILRQSLMRLRSMKNQMEKGVPKQRLEAETGIWG